tara:strand:- start:1689 stop:1934 length:246 start_codon:yes stop_codon:yes gene_type:complete
MAIKRTIEIEIALEENEFELEEVYRIIENLEFSVRVELLCWLADDIRSTTQRGEHGRGKDDQQESAGMQHGEVQPQDQGNT